MKRFSIVIKMDSATKFIMLPASDPLVGEEFVPHLGVNAESDVSISCDVGQYSVTWKRKNGLRPFIAALYDDARKFFLAPLDENRESLLEDNPDLCEDIIDGLGILAVIDNNHFGNRGKVIGEADVERYAKPVLAALRFAKSVANVEKAFYKIDNLKYDVHFDFLHREVIISKKPAPGIRGFFQRRSKRGFGIPQSAKTRHLLSVTVQTPLQNAGNPLQNAPCEKDGQ